MSLCSWHILQLGVVCSLILFTATKTSLLIFQTCSFLHDYWNGLLVSVHFQINYVLFHSQNQWQYQPPNRLKHYSKLTSLFHLLLMWCSTDENSWGLHFTCILQYCSTRTRKFVCVQTFVCVWVPVLFILIAYLRKYAANLFLC